MFFDQPEKKGLLEDQKKADQIIIDKLKESTDKLRKIVDTLSCHVNSSKKIADIAWYGLSRERPSKQQCFIDLKRETKTFSNLIDQFKNLKYLSPEIINNQTTLNNSLLDALSSIQPYKTEEHFNIQDISTLNNLQNITMDFNTHLPAPASPSCTIS